ncbi:LysR substrate-binding domain-containing protein [Mesorhizobium xinjiangense]|uniref:LysR substrate-binding domain-containing protein n=1 Tax=Mesorhizobium xinjiangense TaxID=2678685 RepID=UPI0018DDBBAE|nr:LysR substrate-binding domain-containing protein [Mesorhizobium xinjiangense]
MPLLEFFSNLLEEYLETDLLVRGRSGLQPTPALGAALDGLRAGFAALDKATDKLDFQRAAEIHVVADPDWADLWLLPRLEFFRRKHPNISFNVNGEGDVPMRLGAADCIIDRDTEGHAADGEPLFTERFLPVCSPENQARLEGAFNQPSSVASPKYLPIGALEDRTKLWRHSAAAGLEGFPLLHIQSRPFQPHTPSWREWAETFGYDRAAPERGVRYAHMRDALVRSNAGLLICGLSLVLDDVEAGRLSLPFPICDHVLATSPYRIRIRDAAMARPQVGRFRNWLFSESETTKSRLNRLAAPRSF